jgi:plastocyanin
MMSKTFNPGDGVTWERYGVTHRGTVVDVSRGNVVLIRDHSTWNRTWANAESLHLLNGDA